VQRGSSTHSPREDEALTDQLSGELGPGGSNREEWAAAEPPADDDRPERSDGRDRPGRQSVWVTFSE
jgi:hypothetical protein